PAAQTQALVNEQGTDRSVLRRRHRRGHHLACAEFARARSRRLEFARPWTRGAMAELRRFRRFVHDHRDHLDQSPRHATAHRQRRSHDPAPQSPAPAHDLRPAVHDCADGRLLERERGPEARGGRVQRLVSLHVTCLLRDAAAPAAREGSSAARVFDTRSTAEGATAQRLWLVSPYLTLAICAGLAVFYALPGTTTDVQSA